MTEVCGTFVRERLRETVVQTVLGSGLACMTHDLSFRVELVAQVTTSAITTLMVCQESVAAIVCVGLHLTMAKQVVAHGD